MTFATSDERALGDAQRATWIDYGFAIAAVATATLVRLLLDAALGNDYPFITFFGAVAAVAWGGQTRPALLCIFASGTAASYLFIPPRYSFLPSDIGTIVGLALFGVIGAVMVAMGHALRLERRRTAKLIDQARIQADEFRRTAMREAEQRERLGTTLNSIGDAVIITDKMGNVISLNPVAESLTGWTSSEAMGLPLTDVFHVVHERSRQPIENPALKAINADIVVGLTNDIVLISRDGAERPIDDSAAPIRHGDKEIVGCILVFRDISDQKAQQQAVAASEARLRRVFESNVVGMIRWDLDRSLILDANDTFLHMTGYTRDDISAGRLNFRDMTPSEWRSRNEEGIRTIRTEGHAMPYEKEYFRKDGSRVPLIIAGTRFDDSPSEGMSLIIDISDRIRAEQEIARMAAESDRQRRLYDTVLSNTPDFVYVFSLDHRVLYANDSLIKMWGRGRDGAIGKTFLEIGYEPWHAEMHEQEIDRVRATKQAIRGEVPFTGTNGRRLYEYIFVPVFGADGEVEAVAGTTRDVTERREAEKAIRSTEERLRTALTAARMVAWEWTPGNGKLRVSANAADVFGLPEGESLRGIDQGLALLHPDDVGQYQATFQQAIETRAGYLTCYRLIRPDDGRTIWIEERGHTVFDQPDGGVRLFGVAMDVTERKRAEEQQAFLVRLADTLRPLSDPVEVQLKASRLLGEYLKANRVVYFEIRDDEYIIEQDYTSGVSPLAGRYHVSVFGPSLHKVLLDGHTNIESDATTEPGRSASERAAFAGIQVRAHVDVPLVKSGRFVAGLTVHFSERRDWTREEVALIQETAERTWTAVVKVRAEVALRQSEEQRRLALDAAELGAWHRDLVTGNFTTDERFRVIVGGSTEPMDYEATFLRIHPDDRERVQKAVSAATSSVDRALYNEEYRVVNPDGAVRWVLAKGKANYDRERPERLVSFDGTVADITARKLIEEERERLVGQLREADRRKDEFLATLAHELRNPLAPIRNGLEILRLAGATGTVDEARMMMERQLGQMVRLVDDLLDVSRVTRGKLQLRRERLELRSVIDAALETTRPVVEQAGQDLVVCLPETPVYVEGDFTRLAQVISNLLTNSAKYTQRGGHIRLKLVNDDDTAVISVADDGIGIPPEMLSEVFEMFIQVDRTLEKSTGGLGIGLSLVKGLIEMHGGSVQAKSEGEGKGSEFSVRLPTLPSSVEVPHVDNGVVDHAVPSDSRRILIIDDNADSANSLGKFLEIMNNEVQIRYDGETGIAGADEFRPGVVVCDIGMPKVNGYDVARRIRAEPWGRDMILIALTGWGQENDRKKSSDAGFDYHLVKPVEPASLMKLIAVDP
ncbi:PAS domain S-box protein [Schlesneria sp. T3-172]|uniref:PAS domain S-box protein n=1 Tax=Schlesneria sphaerica TaxID=3373610 RepID=UPI0037C8AE21